MSSFTKRDTHLQTHIYRHTQRDRQTESQSHKRSLSGGQSNLLHISAQICQSVAALVFIFFCVALAKKWGKGRGNWVRGPAQVVCQNYMLKHQHEGSFPVLSVFFCSCLSFPSPIPFWALLC